MPGWRLAHSSSLFSFSLSLSLFHSLLTEAEALLRLLVLAKAEALGEERGKEKKRARNRLDVFVCYIRPYMTAII